MHVNSTKCSRTLLTYHRKTIHYKSRRSENIYIYMKMLREIQLQRFSNRVSRVYPSITYPSRPPIQSTQPICRTSWHVYAISLKWSLFPIFRFSFFRTTDPHFFSVYARLHVCSQSKYALKWIAERNVSRDCIDLVIISSLSSPHLFYHGSHCEQLTVALSNGNSVFIESFRAN